MLTLQHTILKKIASANPSIIVCPLLPHMLSITTANHILTTAVAIGQLVCLQGTEHNLLLQAIIGSTPLPSCTEGQLPKIIMWFRDISYLHLHTNSRGHREYKLTFRRITLILCYQVVTSSVSWQLVYKTEKNIMHLTPFYVTGDFNIFDSNSNNTSDPCSQFISSCLFFFYLHFTTISPFD